MSIAETAPAASTYDMFEKLPHEASVNGGLAIAVPGELRGLEVLHSRHGILNWADVVQPAMDLAENGFEVTGHLAHDIANHGARFAEKFPNLGKLLSRNGDGKTWYKEGDIMLRKEYAATLRAVMRDGADAIYKGPIARAIIRDLQEAGSIITEADMNAYHPILREPLVAHDVGGFTMVGAPPPSSGVSIVVLCVITWFILLGISWVLVSQNAWSYSFNIFFAQSPTIFRELRSLERLDSLQDIQTVSLHFPTL